MRAVSITTGRQPGTLQAPEILIVDGRFAVSLAQTEAELDQALKLRFEVFNLELGEGLESSYQSGRDRDQFDAICHHLIVTDRDNGKVIGTYRLQTIEMTRSWAGFYSAGEFYLRHLPQEILNESVELGRACIAQSHRNRQVLFLLWKGLAQYSASLRKRYLFGCCSLTSQDPVEGVLMSRQLTRDGHMHPTLFVPPNAGYQCAAEPDSVARAREVKVPQLFRTYLSIGAKVCSSAAIDRRFKTIDFLVIFDVDDMDTRQRKIYFGI